MPPAKLPPSGIPMWVFTLIGLALTLGGLMVSIVYQQSSIRYAEGQSDRQIEVNTTRIDQLSKDMANLSEHLHELETSRGKGK